jgi:hypothetical protein
MRHAAERRGLRHAPGLHHADAELLLVRFLQGVRHRRAAARHHAQRGQVAAAGADMREQRVPDRRHGPGQRGPLGLDQPDQRLGLQEPVRHDQVGAGQHRRVGQPPGVGVEHRHHRQHPVLFGQREHVPQADAHRMQVVDRWL